jgi:hypothetical protein
MGIGPTPSAAPLISGDRSGGAMETRNFAIALISTHLGYYPVCRHDHETDAIKETARNRVTPLADEDTNATTVIRP